jgi:hypothetical protein
VVNLIGSAIFYPVGELLNLVPGREIAVIAGTDVADVILLRYIDLVVQQPLRQLLDGISIIGVRMEL